MAKIGQIWVCSHSTTHWAHFDINKASVKNIDTYYINLHDVITTKTNNNETLCIFPVIDNKILRTFPGMYM